MSSPSPTGPHAPSAPARTAAQDDPERLRRVPGIRSLRLGELKITYVPDGAVGLRPRGWLPDSTDADWAAHPQYLDAAGNLTAGIGGLLVELGDRALLIDAGLGPMSAPDDPGNPLTGAIYGGGLLDGLAEVGRAPRHIEAVAFTHLHFDHLGWAWAPEPGHDRPAFTEAEYLFAEPEWSHRELSFAQGTTPEAVATLEPRVRTVVDGEEIFPGVRVLAAPGHTAGHTAYLITSGGRRLLAFGDALHSPIQIGRPQWSAGVDHDPALAARSRHRIVAELERPDTIGFGIHFADVVFGRAEPHPDGLAWHPEP